MKNYKIVLLPLAKRDLTDIIDYLSKFYPSTALKKYDKIMTKITLLQTTPKMCEEYPCAVSDFNYRKMVVEDYLVFYIVLKDTVEIHNIINGKFDIINYLGS